MWQSTQRLLAGLVLVAQGQAPLWIVNPGRHEVHTVGLLQALQPRGHLMQALPTKLNPERQLHTLPVARFECSPQREQVSPGQVRQAAWVQSAQAFEESRYWFRGQVLQVFPKRVPLVQLRQVSALMQAVQLLGQALQLAPLSQEAPSHLHRESVPRLTTIKLLGVVQAVQVTAFEQAEHKLGQA